ncbi:hypothetical protein J14TS2_17090 [Bacillus sp. J14TS2]|uniref:N-acetylmuramoyl-L-alanine amidase n=1 Tax=Bacillus sp. J14TS2 TaxID=2807188 RepID=UPI001B27C76C|nr:N-acetylmuramoyl-L-alanine amidase [Bacillus sp. J14TS2]GIN71234.1 hypothetical protein J14TS2_17090 [Bacillus sp. J14TS2]
MATKNGVPFRQMLVATSKHGIKCPNTMVPKKITIHNTDNQMPAVNEISYMRGNNNEVSFHVAIDEKEAVQGLPFNRNGWHAGDGGNGYGNRNTVGIEMCRNYDRNRNTTNLNDPLSSQFKKTFDNTVKVVAQLCVDLGIVASKSNIKQHKDWSGKHCPSKILNDKTWDQLVNGIIGEYNRLKGKPASKPQPAPSKPKTKSIEQLVDEVIAGKHGSGAERKKSLGNQYDAVQKRVNEKLLGTKSKPKPAEKSIDTLVKETLAGKHGNGEARKKSLGKNYQAVQDVINGNTSTPKKPSKPKGDQKTNSIVDYLKSIKADSSFANRKKLATKHGIKNYSGTPAQNTQLLKKLRG